MRVRPALHPLAALLVALVLSGCTGGGGDAPAAAVSTASAASAEHGPADVAFLQAMHPHHEGAVAMAELAGTRAGDPRVSALAARITAAQAPEIERLEALATAWGVALTGEAHGSEHGETDDAAVLQGLSGPEFDRQLLTRMVAHHEGALPMARAELAAGTSADARALATSVLDAQQAQIEEMQQLLTGL